MIILFGKRDLSTFYEMLLHTVPQKSNEHMRAPSSKSKSKCHIIIFIKCKDHIYDILVYRWVDIMLWSIEILHKCTFPEISSPYKGLRRHGGWHATETYEPKLPAFCYYFCVWEMASVIYWERQCCPTQSNVRIDISRGVWCMINCV